jgi:hypothetical protein
MGIPEPTETYSSSPHLFVDLDIPEGTKGRLSTAPPARAREASASASRDGGRPARSGGARGTSTSRPPRERTHTTDVVRESADGGGTHDGTGPARRKRVRRRRPSGGAGTTPPAA